MSSTSQTKLVVYTANGHTSDITHQVRTPITAYGGASYERKMNIELDIIASYSTDTIKNISDTLTSYLNNKYPTTFKTRMIRGFVNIKDAKQMKYLLSKYAKSCIISTGLNIQLMIFYEINSNNQQIKKNICDPNKCLIYLKMINESIFNQKSLKHLNNIRHFENEYFDKPECKLNEQCEIYKRVVENGSNSNQLDDECHMRLYRHPARAERIKLSANFNSFIYNKNLQKNEPLLKIDMKLWDGDVNTQPNNGFIKQLINEVIVNGYKSDLCLSHQDELNNNYSILNIVNDKLKDMRCIASPINKDHMLALLLYTGGQCNYDLCLSQRNGDYNKWKWFDYCLYYGIHYLSYIEQGGCTLYSGLSNIKLNKSFIEDISFTTYMSSSWIKDVALQFMGNNGMIIEMNSDFKKDYGIFACDVSWISPFPDECEVLFARSLPKCLYKFQCKVLNDSNGIQTVTLSKKRNIWRK